MQCNEITVKTPENSAAPVSSTLALDALNQLREEIIYGKLKPGEKLRVQHLKKEYGVSAATLREALSLLVSESLVTATAQRGFNVAPISLEDLRDISEMRVLLEVRAACKSVENGDEDWEVGLVGAYHRLTNVEEQASDLAGEASDIWEQRNTEFHEALVAACPSHWNRRFRTVLHTHSERYRRMSLQTVGVSRDVHEEHKQIFDAAMVQDVKKLKSVLTQHIEKTFDVVHELVATDHQKGD